MSQSDRGILEKIARVDPDAKIWICGYCPPDSKNPRKRCQSLFFFRIPEGKDSELVAKMALHLAQYHPFEIGILSHDYPYLKEFENLHEKWIK